MIASFIFFFCFVFVVKLSLIRERRRAHLAPRSENAKAGTIGWDTHKSV